MRSFLQKKAGATYFADSAVTANIRKHNLELIFALGGGWHAVVSIVPTEVGVVLIGGLGKMGDELEKLVPKLRLKPGEHQKFIDILEAKGDFKMLHVEIDSDGMESGIGKEYPGMMKQHLQLLGDPTLQKDAQKLANELLDIYYDLRKSSYQALKDLTNYFYD